MKDYIAKNKWLGLVALLIYSLIAAHVVAKVGNALVQQYMPVLVQETEQFLPITLQNGEIVEPKNTVISRSYSDESVNINVVLDTNKDEFEATSLSEPGLYVSKKFIYAVSPQKTEIRSLAEIPDGTVDKQMLQEGADAFIKSADRYMFLVYTAICLVFSILTALIYTILFHWLMAIWFKVSFGHTFNINMLAYALIGIVEVLGGLSFGFVLTLVLLLLANGGVNVAFKEKAAVAQ